MSSARSRDNKRDSDYQGLLAHYAQRQLKELEIDLKCAHVTATGCLGSSGRRSSTSLVINNRTTTAYPTPASTSVTSGGGPVPVDDEFGDFLSTNVTSSAFPVANNRHQDIVVDRYSVFKHLIDDQTIELDGSLQATTSLLECSENSSDEFGEFKSYSLEANVASSSRNPRFEVFLNVWTKVLRCVRRTLTRCHDLLLGPHVNRQAALQAMDTERGHNFCLDLSEMYRLFLRIKQSYEQSPRRVQLEQLIAEIQQKWTLLNHFLKQFTHNSEDHFVSQSKPDFVSNQVCRICFHRKTSANDRLCQVAGLQYHISCANLWLNCVEDCLPDTSLPKESTNKVQSPTPCASSSSVISYQQTKNLANCDFDLYQSEFII